MDLKNMVLTSTRASGVRKLWSASPPLLGSKTFKGIKAAANQLALEMSCAKRGGDHNQLAAQPSVSNLQVSSDSLIRVLNVLIGSDIAGSPYSEFLSPAEINSTAKAFSEQLQHDSALSAFHLVMQQPNLARRPPNARELLNGLKGHANNSPERIQGIARASLGDLADNIPDGLFNSGRFGQRLSFMQFTRNLGPTAVALLKVLDENPAQPDLTSTRTDLTIVQLVKLSYVLAAYVKTLPKNTLPRADAHRFAQHIQGKIAKARAIIKSDPTRLLGVERSRYAKCSDIDVMNAVLQHNGLCLRFASSALRNKHDLVMVAVKNHGLSLQFAGTELRNNPDIVMAAVQNHGLALQHASSELRNNPDVVMAAVQQDGFYLFFSGNGVLNNIRIVTAAVQNYGPALIFASRDLRENRVVVMAAVQNNGLAIRHASGRIRNDLDVVMAAVRQNGLALRYASPELQNNLGIVIAAVKQDSRALQYASENLQNIGM